MDCLYYYTGRTKSLMSMHLFKTNINHFGGYKLVLKYTVESRYIDLERMQLRST